MNDMVVEKLVQKVANMLEEISEINILVRRMTTQETLNRINERVDAIHTAFVQMEKKHAVDDQRLKELEEQTKLFAPALNELKEQIRIHIEADEANKNDMVVLKKNLYYSLNEIKTSVDKFSPGMKELKEQILASIVESDFWPVVLGIPA